MREVKQENLDSSEDGNALNHSDLTPLMEAIRECLPFDEQEKHVSTGAYLHRDAEGWTAAMWAAWTGQFKILELLYAKGCVTHFPDNDLKWVLNTVNSETLAVITRDNAGVSEFTSASLVLILAVSRGHFEIVEWLLDKEKQWGIRRRKHDISLSAVLSGQFEMVRRLVFVHDMPVNSNDQWKAACRHAKRNFPALGEFLEKLDACSHLSACQNLFKKIPMHQRDTRDGAFSEMLQPLDEFVQQHVLDFSLAEVEKLTRLYNALHHGKTFNLKTLAQESQRNPFFPSRGLGELRSLQAQIAECMAIQDIPLGKVSAYYDQAPFQQLLVKKVADSLQRGSREENRVSSLSSQEKSEAKTTLQSPLVVDRSNLNDDEDWVDLAVEERETLLKLRNGAKENHCHLLNMIADDQAARSIMCDVDVSRAREALAKVIIEQVQTLSEKQTLKLSSLYSAIQPRASLIDQEAIANSTGNNGLQGELHNVVAVRSAFPRIFSSPVQSKTQRPREALNTVLKLLMACKDSCADQPELVSALETLHRLYSAHPTHLPAPLPSVTPSGLR